jgi:hypothetical protein
MSKPAAARSWIRGMYSPVSLLAGLAVVALLAAVWPLVTWPFPPGSALDRLIAAVVAVAATAVAVLLTRRTPQCKTRRELILVVAARVDGPWLNREARLSFGIYPHGPSWCRVWRVIRVDDDHALEALTGEGGEQPLHHENFITLPFTPCVVRHDDTVLVDPVTGKVRNLPGGPGVLRSAWRLNKMAAATGTGLVIATPDQVAEVIAQLRAAERIGEEGE